MRWFADLASNKKANPLTDRKGYSGPYCTAKLAAYSCSDECTFACAYECSVCLSYGRAYN